MLSTVEKGGGQALPCIVDIRDEAQIQQSIEEAVSKFGGIDILVNNAGLMMPEQGKKTKQGFEVHV